jgi:exonuclease VII small subunit
LIVGGSINLDRQMQEAAASYERAVRLRKKLSEELAEMHHRMEKIRKSWNREHPPISYGIWVEPE